MKFLFLNSAGVWGGNEKWTYMAATALSNKHQAYLAYRSEVIGERYTIEKIKLPFRWSYDVRTISQLTDIVNNLDVDILIPTKKRDYVLAGLVARRCNKKNVIRLGIVRKLGWNPYKKFVYDSLSHGIIVNAQKIKDVLLESPYMKDEKVRVIYNGIDTDTIDAHSQSESETKNSFPFMVCTVGRISRRKGIDVILKIFAQFIKRIHPQKAGLRVIGEGKRLDEYKKLASELGISELTQFTGFVNNPYPCLRANDVYLTVSQNEGLSNALLEAMYLENAVITSKAGGAGEIIINGKNGILLNDNTIEEGANQLEKLYTDNILRTSIAKSAKKTVKEKCSLTTMTTEIVNFCSEL